MPKTKFNKEYFERYYKDSNTAVVQPEAVQRQCDFVLAYMNFLELPCKTVLDAGCGIGLWKDALTNRMPDLTYHGIDISRDACNHYGWEQTSITEWKSKIKYDLVICQGVLQYLNASDARKAIKNLLRATGGALYLEVLTKLDWEEHCDQNITDGNVYLRTAEWYRTQLSPFFINCGGGLFLPNDTGVVLYDLEHC